MSDPSENGEVLVFWSELGKYWLRMGKNGRELWGKALAPNLLSKRKDGLRLMAKGGVFLPLASQEESLMARCEVCGNDYDRLLEVKLGSGGGTHLFDCFECAIHLLAPECAHCGVKVLGHGVQAGSHLFCGAHCARQQGVRGVVDYVPTVIMQSKWI